MEAQELGGGGREHWLPPACKAWGHIPNSVPRVWKTRVLKHTSVQLVSSDRPTVGGPRPDPEGRKGTQRGTPTPRQQREVGEGGAASPWPTQPQGAPGTYRWPAAPGACRAPGGWHTYERRQAHQS